MLKGFGPSPSSSTSFSSSLSPATDYEHIYQQLLSHFQTLTDPRGRQGTLHPFLSIVIIALLATIAGAQGWEDIEVYALSHQHWLSQLVPLPFGPPSADTFRRLFERIRPAEFEQSFNSWIGSLVAELGAQVIPIDGKQIRGSYDRNRGQSALHVVNAWCSENRLFLGQVRVDSQSNEITALPALLELLDLSGAIITLDAMGTQHDIAQRIQEKGADYVLALKGNHPTLLEQVKNWFESATEAGFKGIEYSYDERVESGHHRQEKRRVYAVSIEHIEGLYKQEQWSGLQSIIRVERTRHLWNKTTHEVMYYISSLPAAAHRIGKVIRQHWSIENQLHWVLDVTWGEDGSRIRNGHAPENMALMRRWGLNLLNRDKSSKRSLRQKTRRASMDVGYMLKVIEALKPSQPGSQGI